MLGGLFFHHFVSSVYFPKKRAFFYSQKMKWGWKRSGHVVDVLTVTFVHSRPCTHKCSCACAAMEVEHRPAPGSCEVGMHAKGQGRRGGPASDLPARPQPRRLAPLWCAWQLHTWLSLGASGASRLCSPPPAGLAGWSVRRTRPAQWGERGCRTAACAHS